MRSLTCSAPDSAKISWQHQKNSVLFICAMAKLHDVWFMVIPCHGNPEKNGRTVYNIMYIYIYNIYVCIYIQYLYIYIILYILYIIYISLLLDWLFPSWPWSIEAAWPLDMASLMIFIGRMMRNSWILDDFGASVLSEKAFLKHAVSGYWWDFQSQPSKT